MDMYRISCRVDLNRIYSYRSRRCRIYDEYVIVKKEQDDVEQLCSEYLWSGHGLTDEHYNGCRACDPSEDVDECHCGFKFTGCERVPVSTFKAVSGIQTLTTDNVKVYHAKRQAEYDAILLVRKQEREQQKALEKQKDAEIAAIEMKYKKRKTK